MELHRCLICIGSNFSQDEMLTFARNELSALFPDIIFGQEMVNPPLFFISNKSSFYNQLGIFHTTITSGEIQAACKDIERKAGRTPEDKIYEKVKLDIDLLQMDQQIFKPEDMKRAYIRKGMEELSSLS